MNAGAAVLRCGSVTGSGARHALLRAGEPRGEYPFVLTQHLSVGNGLDGRPVPLSDAVTFEEYAVLAGAGATPAAAAADAIRSRAAARCTSVLAAAGTLTPACWVEGTRAAAATRVPKSLSAAALAALTIAWPFTSLGRGVLLSSCADVARVIARGPFTAVGAVALVDVLAHGRGGTSPTVVRGGAAVESAVLHAGVSVDGGASVRRSVLFAASGASRGAAVDESLLGPASVVSQGEVTHTLLGPMVGFHHAALLIAGLWPQGRGNVAAGALVGSNHTGRLPDQEARHGEGVFYGLGAVIKLPSDTGAAQYSLFAAGVTALPQRVAFPFSLIASPDAAGAAAGMSPAINEIFPGWVLYDCTFAVHRNEAKFEARVAALEPMRSELPARGGECCDSVEAGYDAARAWYPAVIDAGILDRCDIVDAMRGAAEALRLPGSAAAGAATPKTLSPRPSLYTDAHVPGLGKNYMSEAARVRGLAAYEAAIRGYALRSAADALVILDGGARGGSGLPVAWATRLSRHALEVGAEAGLWPAACVGVVQAAAAAADARGASAATASAVIAALGGATRCAELLAENAAAAAATARSVAASKRKDAERGRRIIADYDFSHPPAAAAKDATIVRLADVARRAEQEATAWARRHGASLQGAPARA